VEVAVTVPRATLCCPVTVKGPIDLRADHVLRCFSTESQWASWVRFGHMEVRGGRSGLRYRVAHRHTPIAIEQTKPAWCIDDNNVVHAHLTFLPPAEEVLALKLALEHREGWIRNASGYYSGPEPHYPNPFMAEDEQGADGLWDAALLREVGQLFQKPEVRRRKCIPVSAFYPI
jgi:hypothetical protein